MQVRKEKEKPDLISRHLREIAAIGIVNYTNDTKWLIMAADLIDEMDERIAIMSEDQYKSGEIRFP